MMGLVERRLDEARAKSIDARRDLLRGERKAAIERLLDAEPLLFEAQALLQALAILGRTDPEAGGREG